VDGDTEPARDRVGISNGGDLVAVEPAMAAARTENQPAVFTLCDSDDDRRSRKWDYTRGHCVAPSHRLRGSMRRAT